MNIKFYIAALVAIMALGLVGCKQTAEGVSEDTQRNVEKVEEGAEKVGETAEAVGSEIKQETKEAVKPVGDAISGGDMTLKVKTALVNAADLKITDIDVDTNGDTKVVTLKGSVPSEDQKKQAQTLAEATAGKGNSKIDNQFTVAGRLSEFNRTTGGDGAGRLPSMKEGRLHDEGDPADRLERDGVRHVAFAPSSARMGGSVTNNAGEDHARET